MVVRVEICKALGYKKQAAPSFAMLTEVMADHDLESISVDITDR